MRPLHLLPDRRPDACLLLLPPHGWVVLSCGAVPLL
jgi:hypothetical protein